MDRAVRAGIYDGGSAARAGHSDEGLYGFCGFERIHADHSEWPNRSYRQGCDFFVIS